MKGRINNQRISKLNFSWYSRVNPYAKHAAVESDSSMCRFWGIEFDFQLKLNASRRRRGTI